jgi:hypothetical protein
MACSAHCLQCDALTPSEFTAVAVSLLGYFLCMIAVLTAAVGVMIGLFNFSNSEGALHYPRPVVQRNITATNEEPRLFMVVPDTKDASPAKNVEAKSTVAPQEKAAEAKTSKPHRHKVIARKRNNYEPPSYGTGMGYAEEFRNAPQRPFSTW